MSTVCFLSALLDVHHDVAIVGRAKKNSILIRGESESLLLSRCRVLLLSRLYTCTGTYTYKSM